MPTPIPDRPRRSGPALWGRRVGIAVIASLFVYLCAVGFASVPHQIFYPERTEWPANITCAVGLRTLQRELADEGAAHAERAMNGGATQDLTEFFGAWDRRHAGLEARCARANKAKAHRMLATFRYRLAADLERMDRTYHALLGSVTAATRPTESPKP